MAKFLNYEDRLEIRKRTEEHVTHRLGERVEETGLPLQRRSGTIPSNRIPVIGYRTIPANTERRAGEKSVEQMIAGIPLVAVCKQCESYVTDTVSTLKICTHRLSRHIYATDAVVKKCTR